MWFVRFILFCVETVNDFLDKNCPYIAGAISFYTLFALFPLLLAVTTVVGYMGPSTREAQMDLAYRLAEVLPVSSSYIGRTLQGIVSARLITGIVSVFGLLWASTAAFGAIRKGVNNAWGIKKTRPFLKERLIDFTLAIGAGALILAVLFSTPALAVMRQATMVLAPESEYFNTVFWDIVARMLLPATAFVTFLILYRFLPNTTVQLKYVWPGALLASIAFDMTNLGFVWFMQNYSTYNIVYGSVGAVVALLTWVYLSAMIVLFGALLTSRYSAYAASLPQGGQNLRILWTGFARVRLRVVRSTAVAA